MYLHTQEHTHTHMNKTITLHKRCKEQRLPFLAPHFHSVLENTTLDHFGVFRVSGEQPCWRGFNSSLSPSPTGHKMLSKCGGACLQSQHLGKGQEGQELRASLSDLEDEDQADCSV